MSGPKSSRYTLSPAQRAALEAELRRRREEEIRKEKVNKCLSKIYATKNRVKSELEKVYRTIDRMEMIGEDSLSNERKVCEEIIKSIAGDSVIKVESSSVEEAENELKRIELVLQKIVDIKANILLECSRVEANKREEIARDLDIGFSLSFTGISKEEAEENTGFFEKVAKVLAQIDSYVLPIELKSEFERISLKANEITDSKFLENFYAISIYPFYEKCKNYNEQYTKAQEAIEELIVIYNCLCAELEMMPENFDLSNVEYEYIDELINGLEAQRNDKAENEYIQQCVDEVMVEMGYELCGNREITKKSGKVIRNELYHFDEGCAVNVTYQDNGQITMELGGVDKTNRIPSKEESNKLVKDMEEFCADFKEIEEKLNEKGVWTNHISILPPAPEYAQIIDVSDYEMNRHLESLSIKNEERKKKKINSQSVIRRNME